MSTRLMEGGRSLRFRRFPMEVILQKMIVAGGLGGRSDGTRIMIWYSREEEDLGKISGQNSPSVKSRVSSQSGRDLSALENSSTGVDVLDLHVFRTTRTVSVVGS